MFFCDLVARNNVDLSKGAQFKEFWSAADRSHALLDTVQGQLSLTYLQKFLNVLF